MVNTYLLTGEEEFLKEERLKVIKKDVLGTTTDHPDYNIYTAKEDDIRTVLDTARLIPFVSDSRLVVLKEIERLKDDKVSILMRYVQQPSRHTCLVLLSVQNIFPASLSNIKEENFKPIRGEGLFRWVKEQFARNHKQIHRQALSLLMENVGQDLYSLSTAIDKLSLYTGKRDIVDVKDVERLVGRDRSLSGFEFIDAIFDNDPIKALRILATLLKEGMTAQEILGLIGWQVNQFYCAAKLLNEGLSQKEIASQLRIPFFKIDTVFDRVKNLRLEDIASGLNLILESDLSIKTGRKTPAKGLESLTLSLCA